MTTKTEFTQEEWEALQKGVTGAGFLIAVSDRSFFDSFKEAGSLAKHLAGGRSDESELVRGLAGERGSGFGARSTSQEIESETVEALRGAVSTLQAKAPDEVEAYKSFVIELAEAVGKAAGGGEAAEAATIEKIRAALN